MKGNLKFSNTLIMWYLINKRDLPWRKSKNPYSIWLSEIILQQTRIAQGTSYYEKFLTEFDDIFALAKADEKTVLKLWQGLGYYSRARNLHATAKIIANEHQGRFPNTYEDLVKLKGVGDYTASAIASIAFDLPHAVVDGNVYRVLSRIFGISTPINETKGIKEFKLLANQLLDQNHPGDHNQALMEFGALVCTPKKPKCDTCIFNNICLALKDQKVDSLPVKIKKHTIKKRYFNFLVIDYKGESTILRQRQKKDIWLNLFEFPLYESTDDLKDEIEIIDFIEKEKLLDSRFTIKQFNKTPINHKLTHQTLHTFFWIIEPEDCPKKLTPWKEIENFALPVLLQNFVDKYHSGN